MKIKIKLLTKILKLIFIIVTLFVYGSAFSQDLSNSDNYLIIKITPNDLGLKSDAYDNDRGKYRKVHLSLIEQLKNDAQFIILDMWYPDIIDFEIDSKIKKIITNAKNIYFPIGGYHEEKYESSSPFYLDSGKGYYHIFGKMNNDSHETPLYLCFSGVKTEENENMKDLCGNEEVAVPYIALSIFKKDDIKKINKSSLYVSKKDFKRIRMITLKEYKILKSDIKNKIIIIVNLPDNTDKHYWNKNEFVYGSEIIVNDMMALAKLFDKGK